MNRQMIKGRDASTELQLINTLGGGDCSIDLLFEGRRTGETIAKRIFHACMFRDVLIGG